MTSVQLIFAVAVAAAVFFLVPRGVSLGGITVQTEHRSWNFSEHTYKLNLIAQIPVYNPNYLSVTPQQFGSHSLYEEYRVHISSLLYGAYLQMHQAQHFLGDL